MIAGITIDEWKLEAFERALRDAGLEYEVRRGPDGIVIIRVTCEDAWALAPLVSRAMKECEAQAERKNLH